MDDLIATAERQLASRSYDAAIDTYRTALGEPGAAEAGVGALLDAACRARDEARGIVRPAEAAAAAPPAPSVEVAAEPPAAPRVEPQPEPVVQAAVVDDRPIEPPSFHLIEDDPPLLETYDRERYRAPEVERLSILDPAPRSAFQLREDAASAALENARPDRYSEIDVRSILDPTPAPETPYPAGTLVRILIAMVIAIGVVVVAYYVK